MINIMEINIIQMNNSQDVIKQQPRQGWAKVHNGRMKLAMMNFYYLMYLRTNCWRIGLMCKVNHHIRIDK